MYSSSVRGRSAPSTTRSASSIRSGARMRERSSAILARVPRATPVSHECSIRRAGPLGLKSRLRNPHFPGRTSVQNDAMRLSRRSEYGLRALVDLVRSEAAMASTNHPHPHPAPVALGTLARRNNLPPKFLEQIMSTLKRGGIVRTTLGAHGGYAMAVDPSSVSLGRVVRMRDGALAPLACVSLRYYEPCSCPDESTCSLRDVMLDVRDVMLEILDRETLADLAARQGRSSIDPRNRHGEALAGRRP